MKFNALASSISAAPLAAAVLINSRRRVAFIDAPFELEVKRVVTSNQTEKCETEKWNLFFCLTFLFRIFLSHIFLSRLSLHYLRKNSLIGLAFFFALTRFRFEAFDFLKLAGGFLFPSQLLIAARKQVAGLRIVRLFA